MFFQTPGKGRLGPIYPPLLSCLTREGANLHPHFMCFQTPGMGRLGPIYPPLFSCLTTEGANHRHLIIFQPPRRGRVGLIYIPLLSCMSDQISGMYDTRGSTNTPLMNVWPQREPHQFSSFSCMSDARGSHMNIHL